MNGGQLAGGNSTSKKADNDFYTTNPKTVELFLEKFIQDGNDLQDLEDKTNAIESASANLSYMKKFVLSMKKSDMKTQLLSCIEDMETDLC